MFFTDACLKKCSFITLQIKNRAARKKNPWQSGCLKEIGPVTFRAKISKMAWLYQGCSQTNMYLGSIYPKKNDSFITRLYIIDKENMKKIAFFFVLFHGMKKVSTLCHFKEKEGSGDNPETLSMTGAGAGN
jgi:hypothetical protein